MLTKKKENHSFDRMTSNLCTIILEETNKVLTQSTSLLEKCYQ